MSDRKTDEIKGRAKEAAGAVAGDDELKNEGKTDQAAASVKEKVEGAVDKVKDKLTGK
ncbi:MAG: CsbD family protein [Solirubrobacterales bacterium]|nr:CsbD family protein [Solirubrobacterales bacterium]